MTTPESPVTPGNDAVLAEWADKFYFTAVGEAPVMPDLSSLVRSLCEAVAAAERERCAAECDKERAEGSCECSTCRPWAVKAACIRSLRGLPEIGRPGK